MVDVLEGACLDRFVCGLELCVYLRYVGLVCENHVREAYDTQVMRPQRPTTELDQNGPSAATKLEYCSILVVVLFVSVGFSSVFCVCFVFCCFLLFLIFIISLAPKKEKFQKKKGPSFFHSNPLGLIFLPAGVEAPEACGPEVRHDRLRRVIFTCETDL